MLRAEVTGRCARNRRALNLFSIKLYAKIVIDFPCHLPCKPSSRPREPMTRTPIEVRNRSIRFSGSDKFPSPAYFYLSLQSECGWDVEEFGIIEKRFGWPK